MEAKKIRLTNETYDLDFFIKLREEREKKNVKKVTKKGRPPKKQKKVEK